MIESRLTYRGSCIAEIAREMKQGSIVPELLAKLYARLACFKCGKYGDCGHREKASDMDAIQRAARRLG